MPWVFDGGHSVIAFDNRHFGIATVKGRFNGVEVNLQVDEDDLTRSSVEVTLDATSVDTGIEQRDDQLRGDVYLDVARFPTIEFHSTRIEPRGDGYAIIGDLTLHGTTREVAVESTFNGQAVDQRGRQRRGFSGRTTIRRSDFGIGTTIVEGIPMASEEIQLFFEIEASLRE